MFSGAFTGQPCNIRQALTVVMFIAAIQTRVTWCCRCFLLRQHDTNHTVIIPVSHHNQLVHACRQEEQSTDVAQKGCLHLVYIIGANPASRLSFVTLHFNCV